MKITIEKNDGEIEVHQDITDLYIATRQLVPGIGRDQRLIEMCIPHSYSWGPNVRELVKEITQSLIELQEYLKEHRHGGTG